MSAHAAGPPFQMPTSPLIPALMRACRQRTGLTYGFRWEVGLVRDEDYHNFPFKPGIIPGIPFTEADAAASVSWSGDREPWDFALEHARVGHAMDFYVHSVGPSGELVDHVNVFICSDTQAVVCRHGEPPRTVSLEPAG